MIVCVGVVGRTLLSVDDPNRVDETKLSRAYFFYLFFAPSPHKERPAGDRREVAASLCRCRCLSLHSPLPTLISSPSERQCKEPLYRRQCVVKRADTQ